MQDKARFFAYATWTLMISLAIILFSNQFLYLVSEPGWTGYLILIAFGFVYMNLCYGAVKRFIKKVPAPTKLHILLGVLIALPPAIWIVLVRNPFGSTEILLLAVLVLSCGLGVFYGNRAGIKARYEYVQKLKDYQEKLL